MDAFEPEHPVCFVSTHLDDVALSCSHFLASHPGATVITVFAGAPDVPAGSWDRATTGKTRAREALAVRRAEDAAAMANLSATPVWLDLGDSQYVPGNRQTPEEVRSAIRGALDELRPATIVAPLGVQHPDHVAVSDACLTLAGELAADWYLYQDMPYAQVWADTAEARVRHVGGQVAELVALAVVSPLDRDAKRNAVALYRSQLDAVGRGRSGFDAVMTDPERYWRIAPRPSA